MHTVPDDGSDVTAYPAPVEGALYPYPSDPWIPGLLRPLVGIPTATAALAAGITGAVQGSRGPGLDMAVGIVCAALVVLAVIDAQTHRLPDVIVLPLYAAVGIPMLYSAAAGTISWSDAGFAGLCMLVMLAVMGAVHFVTAGGLGFGDVKLSGVLGLTLGVYGGYETLIGGYVLPCLLGGAAAFTMMFTGRGKGLAFGPYLAAGALAVLLMPELIVPFVREAAG